jgi:multidrug resistance efflux pump
VLRASILTAAVLALLGTRSLAQDGPLAAHSVDGTIQELDSQVRELRAAIDQMRAENAQSRAEMRELRQELQDTRRLLEPHIAASNQPAPSSPAQTVYGADSVAATTSAANSSSVPSTDESSDLGSRVQRLEESTQLLGSNTRPRWRRPGSIARGSPELFS